MLKRIMTCAVLALLVGSCNKEKGEDPQGSTGETAALFSANSPHQASLDDGTWHVPNNLPLDQSASVGVSDALVWNNAPLVSISSAGGAGAGSLQLKSFDGNAWNFLADGNYVLAQTENGTLYGLKQNYTSPQREVILAQLEPGASEWTTLHTSLFDASTSLFNWILPEGNDLYLLRNVGDASTASDWKLNTYKWSGTGWDLEQENVLVNSAPMVASNNVEAYHFGTKYIVRLVLIEPGNSSSQQYVFYELDAGVLKEIYRYDNNADINIQLGRVLWANGQYYYAAVDQLYALDNGLLTSEEQVAAGHNWYWADSDGENIFLWTANGGSGVHVDVRNKSGQWAKLPVTSDYTNVQHKFSMARLYWLYKHMSFFEWNGQFVFAGTSDYSSVDYSIAAFYSLAD